HSLNCGLDRSTTVQSTLFLARNCSAFVQYDWYGCGSSFNSCGLIGMRFSGRAIDPQWLDVGVIEIAATVEPRGRMRNKFLVFPLAAVDGKSVENCRQGGFSEGVREGFLGCL